MGTVDDLFRVSFFTFFRGIKTLYFYCYLTFAIVGKQVNRCPSECGGKR